MKARIANFRQGRHTVYHNQMILQIDDVDSREKAKDLVGKKVTWQAPGKNNTTITGEISAAHGNSGAVRVIFERGMPGQSLGKEVKVE